MLHKIQDEIQVLTNFHDEIRKNSNKFCLGVKETMQAFEMGAIDTLIVFENLGIQRFLLKSPSSGKRKVAFLTPEEEKDESNFYDSGVKLQIEEKVNLTEWLIDCYKTKCAKVKIISSTSTEGSNFVKMGGIGGILRYEIDLAFIVEFLDINEDRN